jgi:hypothetical protein
MVQNETSPVCLAGPDGQVELAGSKLGEVDWAENDADLHWHHLEWTTRSSFPVRRVPKDGASHVEATETELSTRPSRKILDGWKPTHFARRLGLDYRFSLD